MSLTGRNRPLSGEGHVREHPRATIADPAYMRPFVDDDWLFVARMNFDEVHAPAEDNELRAEDAAYVCGRCRRRITAGQVMRRRASGGWAHEEC
jgi:hypothetical protein